MAGPRSSSRMMADAAQAERRVEILEQECQYTVDVNRALLAKLLAARKCRKRLLAERAFLAKRLLLRGGAGLDAAAATALQAVADEDVRTAAADPPGVEVRLVLPLTGDLVREKPKEGIRKAPAVAAAGAAKAAKPAKSKPSKKQAKPAGAAPRASSSKKQPRNQSVPKRPTNAFLMFCRDNRSKVMEGCKQDRGAHHESTRILADQWKTLPEAEKQQYYERYEEDKKRYAAELATLAEGAKSLPQEAPPPPGEAMDVHETEGDAGQSDGESDMP